MNLKDKVTLFDQEYEKGNPLISDSEFDRLYKELKKEDPNNPIFKKITYVKVDGLETIKHSTPMLSLDKANDYNHLKKWFSQLLDDVIAQFKLDGLTIVLRYRNGKLVDAVTRGDGYEGDRVLHTIETAKNLPKEISFKGDLEVRAEVYVPFADFERVNSLLPADQQYANSRSLAAGTTRMLDANIAAERGLEIQVFDLIHAEGKEFELDTESLEFLEEQGFPVVKTTFFSDFHRLTSFLSKIEKEVRPELPFPIDGMVIKTNNLSVRESLGYTSKHPRWGIAYKFESEEAFTTLIDIVCQIGKSGQATPVAIFKPIEIGGVTINKATLHNYQFVQEKDIRIGDRIVVARANDVIPKVIKSFPELRKEDYPVCNTPKTCPECSSVITQDGPLAFCTGGNCPAQNIGKIIHYCGREAMDIEGMGDTTVELLYNAGIIKEIPDLYELHQKVTEIIRLEGFGKKKVDKILKGIEASKNKPFPKLLYALSIPHIGRTNSPAIADMTGSIDTLIITSRDSLREIDGIGEIMADAIVEFFSKEKNLALISKLKDAGVNMIAEKINKKEMEDEIMTGKLAGKTIVITGTLSLKRSEVEDLIRTNGGKPSGSVSKKTDFVILGPDKSGSAKHRKAISLGIPIISESEFQDILKVG